MRVICIKQKIFNLCHSIKLNKKQFDCENYEMLSVFIRKFHSNFELKIQKENFILNSRTFQKIFNL